MVRDPAELAGFRATAYTADAVLAALERSPGGKLLLPHVQGVGKSTLGDELAERALAGELGGPMLFLTSRRSILKERPWARLAHHRRHGRGNPPVALLFGRPGKRCGGLDEDWRAYESAGCGLLGKKELCGRCPHLRSCAWPTQFTRERLEGVRVVGAVQTYAALIPNIVSQLKQKTGAEELLVFLDEGMLLDEPYRARLETGELQDSLDVLHHAIHRAGHAGDADVSRLEKHVQALEFLLDPLADLEEYAAPPRLLAPEARLVQQVGLELQPGRFRYLGFELGTLGYCRRWRDPDGGGVSYIRRPFLRKARYILASAGVPLILARHRLGEPPLEAYRPDFVFLHEGTTICNLRSFLGSQHNFTKNAPQILFTLAQLIAKLAAEGKRTLVVSKKRLAADAARMLTGYLRELTGERYRVVKAPPPRTLTDRLVVPLISYGAQGVNTYQDFDAALALNGFYAREDVIQERLNEVELPEFAVGLEMAFGTKGRTLLPKGYWNWRSGARPLAAAYQQHLESSWVEQALGRVRYAVKPRLVLFFQATPLSCPVDMEFRTLDALRQHFGLLTRRQWEVARFEYEVRELRLKGLKTGVIAKALSRHPSTVRRALARLRKASAEGAHES